MKKTGRIKVQHRDFVSVVIGSQWDPCHKDPVGSWDPITTEAKSQGCTLTCPIFLFHWLSTDI